jgi:UTP--glucose-1-phosphate uridylyltransferase
MRRIAEMARIHFIRQHEPKGLGHAVYMARTFVGTSPSPSFWATISFTNAGEGAAGQLCRAYDKTQRSILGVQEVLPEQVERYGVITPGKADGA